MGSVQLQVYGANIPRRGSPDASLATIWLWAVCIFMLTTPFYFILTGSSPDISIARDAATGRRPEGANFGFYMLRVATLALALYLSRRDLRLPIRYVPRSWPMVLFLSWAALSLLWTEAVGTTSNALFSLASLIIFSLIITNCLKPNDVIRSIICAGIILSAASFFWGIAVPSQGVHQLSDTGQTVHAGNWRGVYIHKNALGQVCAMFAVVAFLSGRESFSLIGRICLIVSMLILIKLSGSGSAVAILVMAPIISLIVVFFPGWMKVFIVGLGLLLAIFVYGFIGEILSMLGRDATLTGRTGIWELAFSYIRENPLSGFGYMAPYSDFAFQAQRRVNVFEPHNGYIDITLGLGLVGLILFVAAMLLSLHASRRVYLTAGPEGRGALAFAGLTSAWLVACMAESAARPTGAAAALGFLSLGILTYRGWELRSSSRPSGAGLSPALSR